MEIKHINKPQLNLDSLHGGILEKAFQEGVYADTPANRKLGRVGMSYKQVKEMEEKKEAQAAKNQEKDSTSKKAMKELSRICKDTLGNFDELMNTISFSNEEISDDWNEGKKVQGSIKAVSKICAAYVTGTVIIPASLGLAIAKVQVDSEKIHEKVQGILDNIADGTAKEKIKEKLGNFMKSVKKLISSFNKNSIEAYNKFAEKHKDLAKGKATYLPSKGKQQILDVLKEKKIPIETKEVRGKECNYFKVGGIEYGLEDHGLHVYGSDKATHEMSDKMNLQYLSKQLGDKNIGKIELKTRESAGPRGENYE